MKNLLYNVQTGKPETLPEGEIQTAIASGTHAFKRGERVNVIGEDGAAQSIPTDEIFQALQEGYRLETPTEGAITDYVEDNKGVSGSLKAFGAKALSEAAYGVPELIYEKTGDPLEVAKFEALKKDHAIATGAGALAGFGASVVAGGPIVKGATAAGNLAQKAVANRLAAVGVKNSSKVAAKVTASMAEKAAKLGAEGLVYSAPRAITEASLGDPEAAAESILWGVGIGAGLGAAGGSLSPALKKLTEARGAVDAAEAGAPGMFQQFKNERAAKALGFTKSQIKKVGGQKQAEQVGADILQARTKDGQKIIGRYDSTEKIAENLFKYQKELGNDIASVYTKIDDSGQTFFSPIKVNERLQSELGDFYRSPLNKDEANLFENLLETVGWSEQSLTLKRAKEILDVVDNIAYPKGQRPLSPSTKQLLAQDARRIIREELNIAAEQGAQAIGDTALSSLLLDSNKKISSAIKAGKAIQDKISSEQGNKFFGLTDVIAGAGVGAVDPVTGAATVAIKKLGEKFGNQFLANLDVSGLLFAEKAMKRAANEVDRIPEVIKTAGSVGKKAASVGGLLTLTRLFGEEMSAEEIASRKKEDLLKELSQKASLIVSNPDAVMKEGTELMAPIEKGGAPTVAAKMAERIGKSRQYLYDALPKPITPNTPFYKSPWKPSDMEIQSFENKLETLQNPFIVIDRIGDGTLTQDHVEALSQNFPSLYNSIKNKVIQSVIDNPADINYQARLKLSLLLGVDLDPTLNPGFLQTLSAMNTLKEQQDQSTSMPQPKADSLSLAQRTADIRMA